MKLLHSFIIGSMLICCVAFGIYLTYQMIYATYIMYGGWWFVWYIIAAIASFIFSIELVRTWTK